MTAAIVDGFEQMRLHAKPWLWCTLTVMLVANCSAQGRSPAPRNRLVVAEAVVVLTIPAPVATLASRLRDMRVVGTEELVVREDRLCEGVADAAQWEALLVSDGYYVQRATLLGAAVALRFRRGDVFGDAFVYSAGACQRAVVRAKVAPRDGTVHWRSPSPIEWPPLVTQRNPSLYCYRPFTQDANLPFDSRQYEYGCVKVGDRPSGGR